MQRSFSKLRTFWALALLLIASCVAVTIYFGTKREVPGQEHVQIKRSRFQFNPTELVATAAGLLPMLDTEIKNDEADALLKRIYVSRKLNNKNPSYVIIPGGSQQQIENIRIPYLIKLWQEEGLQLEKAQLVILSAGRQLDATQEDVTLGRTEAEMMRTLLARSPLTQFSPLVAEAAPTPDREAPNLENAADAFVAKRPTPGSVLVITEEPYQNRFETLFIGALPVEFPVEVVGPELDPSTSKEELITELGRTVEQYKTYLFSE